MPSYWWPERAGAPVVAHRRDVVALVELAVAGQAEHVADLLLVVLDRGDVVAVDAEVLAELRREARQRRAASASGAAALPIAPAERIRTLHSISDRAAGRLPRRVGAVVVDLRRGHDVAVGPRGLGATSSASEFGPHLDARAARPRPGSW